jgi:ElaB/YqjD/DUF883 family membrane-anchored ribosome-binding protein
MSTAKKKVTAKISRFAVVREIAADLKAGVEGQMDAFCIKVEDRLNNDIEIAKDNISRIKINHKGLVREANYKIEDAQNSLANSYKDIAADKIGTNADQTSYLDTYIDRISTRRRWLSDLKMELEVLTEDYNSQIKEQESIISNRKEHLAILVG